MSTDQPPPGGQPPEDDPFLKKPQDDPPPTPPPTPPTPPPSGSPYGDAPSGGAPYGGPPQGSPPYGGNAPPPPYSGGAADPLAGMPPLAPTGSRLVARIVDALIVGIPMSLLGWLIGMFDGYSSDWDDISDQAGGGKSLFWQLITMVVYVGYDTYMTSNKNGQTVGKRLMGLRVAMLNSGTVPETSASLMRAVVLWVPALICCFCIWWLVNLIMILVDKPYKQGLHDKAAKTVVVSAT
ncbi:RDD family protein [Streptomyces sp. 21So2-11]|uniref:RDD family protein n=1 Tax=Streptomyces sp. 21So2-11 TaxID=3144408 RepID=UPI00321AAC07